MKNICILILTLMLIPIYTFAAVDDSAVKVFTLTPDKMLGMGVNVNYEDSPNMAICNNLVNQDFGLSHFTNGDIIQTLTLYHYYNDRIMEASDTFYTCRAAGGNDPYPSPSYYKASTNAMTSISDFAYTTGVSSEVFVFNGLYSGAQATFLVCNKGISVHNYTTKANITSVLPPEWSTSFSPNTFAIWKSRLFVANSNNEIWYSRAGDYTNFTTGPYLGGYILIQPQCTIRKILATNNGLYVFTSDGIYYISGGLPETWRRDKISELKISGTTANLIDNNNVAFLDEKLSLYTISNGYTVTKITEIPDKTWTFAASGIHFFSDRYIVVTNSALYGYLTDTRAYDLVKKCWYKWNSIISASTNYYITAPRSDINSPQRYYVCRKNINTCDANVALSACGTYLNYYFIDLTTPYYSLDGSDATYKKLKRIEIDCKIYQTKDAGVNYDYDFLSADTHNVLLATVKTGSQIGFSYSRKFVMSGGAGTVSLTAPAVTYSLRFPELDEFKKINLRLSTTGGFILKQIRFYYEPCGVKQ